jgi:putative transposase
MSDTYTEIHLQCVFAVKYRLALIHPVWEELLYKYIAGIVRNQGHKLLAINGMPDHVHLFLGLRPVQAVSDLMREIKGDSSLWINKQGLAEGRFKWQEGFGAFSYKKSDVPIICRYIANQKEHHRKNSFLVEYEELLKEFEVTYKKDYLFREPE